MKHPKFKLNKKMKIKGLRKIKNNIRELVHDGLLDIEAYIVKDIMDYLKKIGVVYAEKKKTNKKKK